MFHKGPTHTTREFSEEHSVLPVAKHNISFTAEVFFVFAWGVARLNRGTCTVDAFNCIVLVGQE